MPGAKNKPFAKLSWLQCGLGSGVASDMRAPLLAALISSPIVISKTFYGTGECFLFKAKPEFEVYNWSQENSNFVR